MGKGSRVCLWLQSRAGRDIFSQVSQTNLGFVVGLLKPAGYLFLLFVFSNTFSSYLYNSTHSYLVYHKTQD